MMMPMPTPKNIGSKELGALAGIGALFTFGMTIGALAQRDSRFAVPVAIIGTITTLLIMMAMFKKSQERRALTAPLPAHDVEAKAALQSPGEQQGPQVSPA